MIITDLYLPNAKYCAFVSDDERHKYKQWPDERGVQPRDLSLGYIDNKEFGRLHVYHIGMFKEKIKNL